MLRGVRAQRGGLGGCGGELTIPFAGVREAHPGRASLTTASLTRASLTRETSVCTVVRNGVLATGSDT